MRVFYAAGPGDIIYAHKLWKSQTDDPNQVALTYSGQFATWCQNVGADAYIVSCHTKRATLNDGQFRLEHLPKPAWGSGIRFHLAEVFYGWQLYRRAAKFRSDVAVISSGSTHYFTLLLMWMSGIKVVLSLHNTLWPVGHKPGGFVQKTIRRLDSLLFCRAHAIIGISPECIRQVDELTYGKHGRAVVMRPMFRRSGFALEVLPAAKPFRMLYTGRISADKGVFDVIETARRVDANQPGGAFWEIYGDGQDLAELRERAKDLPYVSIKGHAGGDEIRKALARSHAVIVPTSGRFCEGLAKSAVESILAGRPAIVSSTVPAKEVLEGSCVVVDPGDVEGFTKAVLSLASDAAHYEKLQSDCSRHRDAFFDLNNGFTATLQRVAGP